MQNSHSAKGLAPVSTINQNEINEYRDDIRMLKAMLVYLEGNEHSAVEMVIHTRSGRKMHHAVETNANMVTALKLELADIQALLYNAESEQKPTVLNASPGQGNAFASIVKKIGDLKVTGFPAPATIQQSDFYKELLQIVMDAREQVGAIKNPFVIDPSMFHKPVSFNPNNHEQTK
jgi:hypothetical protein